MGEQSLRKTKGTTGAYKVSSRCLGAPGNRGGNENGFGVAGGKRRQCADEGDCPGNGVTLDGGKGRGWRRAKGPKKWEKLHDGPV